METAASGFCSQSHRRNIRPIAWLVLSTALSACASQNPGQTHLPLRPIDQALANGDLLCTDNHRLSDGELKEHILIVDRKGEINEFDERFLTILKAYLKFRRALLQSNRHKDKQPPPEKILIYFNGGLNPKETVQRQALAQIGCMKKAGYFPIFLIWRTGALETYWEQVSKVRNGLLEDNYPAQAATPFYILGDIGEGLFRAPVTYANQLSLFWESKIQEGQDEYKEKFELNKNTRGRYRRSDEVSQKNNILFEDRPGFNNPPEDPRGDLLYLLGFPSRVLVTPFLDAMGRTAWENMVRRTRVNIRTTSEFQKSAPGDTDRYRKGTGGFSKFFHHLRACILGSTEDCPKTTNAESPPEGNAPLKHVRLTVIGHSMGTIMLNELIRQYDNLPYQNIVYMAAACSVRDFDNSVVPLLARKNEDLRFYSLMLHPKAEAREATFGGALPSGSLLEWIDDMYENPKTVPDRTLGKWRNLRRVKHMFLPKAQSKMIFKVFGFRRESGKRGEPGYRPADPIRHAEFNDTHMYFWLPEFWGEKDVDWCQGAGDKEKCRDEETRR